MKIVETRGQFSIGAGWNRAEMVAKEISPVSVRCDNCVTGSFPFFSLHDHLVFLPPLLGAPQPHHCYVTCFKQPRCLPPVAAETWAAASSVFLFPRSQSKSRPHMWWVAKNLPVTKKTLLLLTASQQVSGWFVSTCHPEPTWAHVTLSHTHTNAHTHVQTLDQIWAVWSMSLNLTQRPFCADGWIQAGILILFFIIFIHLDGHQCIHIHCAEFDSHARTKTYTHRKKKHAKACINTYIHVLHTSAAALCKTGRKRARPWSPS